MSMNNLITLPVSDRWLFSVDVVRMPDNRIVARLADMRSSEIQFEEQPRHALLRLAKLLGEAAEGMAAEAALIGDATASHPVGTNR